MTPSCLAAAVACLMTIAAPLSVLAQAPPPEAREAFDAPQRLSYEERVRRERLDGHYIPYDIPDAMRELDEITSVTSQDAYAARDEEFAVRRLYFSFGRWLGLNWSLYEGSRLSAYFRELGVDSPDGQIEMLMRLWHRHLNNEDLGIKQLAEAYKAEKAAAAEEGSSGATVIDGRFEAAPDVERGNPRGG